MSSEQLSYILFDGLRIYLPSWLVITEVWVQVTHLLQGTYLLLIDRQLLLAIV